MIPDEARLISLRVVPGRRWRGRPLYREIVESARRLGLAGASVFTAELSLESDGVVHDARSDYSSAEVPVIVEIVEAAERIEELLAELGPEVDVARATIEEVRVLRYAPHGDRGDAITGAGSWESDPPGNPVHDLREPAMPLDGDAQRLTIYLGSSDQWHGQNLALAIVERCRSAGVAGVTVSRGIVGFGKHSRIHRARLLGLSEDLPERIDIVDQADRIARVLPDLEAMLDGGLMIIQEVKVLHYRHHEDAEGHAP